MAVSPSPLRRLTDALDQATPLDPPAKAAAKLVRGALQPGVLRDGLSGTWLGHPLHPLLTDVVIGSLTSATLLDLLGEDEDAAERLVLVALAAYTPTALSGAGDWADSEYDDAAARRVGLIHAVTNAAAMLLYGASLIAARADGGRPKALRLAGAGLLGLGGYLGGHLAYGRGLGADQTVFDPGPGDWTFAIEERELEEATPTRVVVGDTPVLLVRHGVAIRALHDRCSHRGCSLSDGRLHTHAIECGCHGSTFRLADGGIERGPAAAPQPSFDTRALDGRVEIRRRPRA